MRALSGLVLTGVLLFPGLVAAADDPVAAGGGASVVVPIGGATVIYPKEPGTLLFAYIGIIFKFLAGITGLVLLVFIVFYGFEIMFSGIADRTAEAKKGLMASVGGFILLLTSGLLLYTLNPSFFRGFGTESGGKIIGETGTGPLPNTNPTPQPTGDTPPAQAVIGQVMCTEVAKVDCAVPANIKQLASNVLSNPNISVESSAPLRGSDARSNLNDLAAGKCPGVQGGVRGDTCEPGTIDSRLCEQDPTGTTKRYIGNASRSLAGLNAIGSAGYKVNVSALYGNQHSCAEHRHLRAFDLNIINGKRVINMGGAEACKLAQNLKSISGANSALGPLAIGGSCTGITPEKHHNNHFHLAWSIGGGSSLTGTNAAANFSEENGGESIETSYER